MAIQDWPGITLEQLRKLRHHPTVVERCVQQAQQLVDQCNAAAAQYNRPSEKGNPNYGITLQNSPHTQRARVFVHPLGRTGIHVEQAQSVLLKMAGSMGAVAPRMTANQVTETDHSSSGTTTRPINESTLESQYKAMG